MNVAWQFPHIPKILQERGFNSRTEFTGMNHILLNHGRIAGHLQSGGKGGSRPGSRDPGASQGVSDRLWDRQWASFF